MSYRTLRLFFPFTLEPRRPQGFLRATPNRVTSRHDLHRCTCPVSSLGSREAEMGTSIRRVKLVSEDHSHTPTLALTCPVTLSKRTFRSRHFLHLDKVVIQVNRYHVTITCH